MTRALEIERKENNTIRCVVWEKDGEGWKRIVDIWETHDNRINALRNYFRGHKDVTLVMCKDRECRLPKEIFPRLTNVFNAALKVAGIE